MATEIVVPADSHSTIRVSLSGKYVLMKFKYNQRSDCWYLDIYESDNETVIISGIMIKPNQNLTGRYILPSLPSGNLWCFRKQSASGEVGKNGLQGDYGLLWVPSSEELEVNINDRISI